MVGGDGLQNALLEQRLRDLCGFIVAQMRQGGKRKVTLLIEEQTFGVTSIEELMNPRHPIPFAHALFGPTGQQVAESAFCN